VLAISKKNALTVVKQKRTLALMFIAPIIAMALFGYAFGGHARSVPMVIVNQDAGYASPSNGTTVYVSRLVISNLKNSVDPDNITYSISYRSSLSDALDALKNGTVTAVVYFPPDFSKNTFENIRSHSDAANASVVAYVDNSNIIGGDGTPGEVGTAAGIVDQALGQRSAIDVVANPIYGAVVSFEDYFIPGIISFVVFFLPALMTLLLFVIEKSSGTYERILSTPLTEGELVAGYALTFGSLAIAQSTLLFLSGIAAFGLSITLAGFLSALFIIILEAIGSQAFGILLSGFAKRADQAVQLLPFVVLPALTLTGAIQPLDVMPAWLQPVSYVLPPTYATDALRDVLIKDWSLAQIWLYPAILLVFAAVFLVGATLSFRRR
jgi:ABC-2 type transport system permease protein